MKNQKVFCENIEDETIKNKDYRRVVYTGKLQFVYMSINPLDNIHLETHKEHDQFIRIEKGKGIAIINDKEYDLYDGIGIIIPAGAQHKITNTSNTEYLKLYTIYSPPEHKDNKIDTTNPDKFKNKYLKYKQKYLKQKKYYS